MVIGVRTEPARQAISSENARSPVTKASMTARPQRPRAGASAWPETDVSARKTFSFAHKGCATQWAPCTAGTWNLAEEMHDLSLRIH